MHDQLYSNASGFGYASGAHAGANNTTGTKNGETRPVAARPAPASCPQRCRTAAVHAGERVHVAHGCYRRATTTSGRAALWG